MKSQKLFVFRPECISGLTLDIGTNNLLSITYIVKKDYIINFGTNLCKISKARLVIRKTESRKGLWILNRDPIVPSPQAVHVIKASLDIWYKWLGHIMTCLVQRL